MNTKDIEEIVEDMRDKLDLDCWSPECACTGSEKAEAWLRNALASVLTSRDTYWKEKLEQVRCDVEALRGTPQDTHIERAKTISDVHKILDILLNDSK